MSNARFSVLRDPVHGDVYLSHDELAVLDTPEMQRLRGVRQLGTAFLAYPGAVHTRFDHSIGVLHVTDRLLAALSRNHELAPGTSLPVGEDEARVIRIAALVHDVTHIPYGHNIEDQTGLFHRHDSAYRFRRMFEPTTELGRELERLGVREDVLGTLLPDEDEGRRVPPYAPQILSDTISPDILDYLQRDAYFTGLRLGVDPRIANYFRIDPATRLLYIDLAKRDLLREDILSEVVRMLEARYYFSERVYYHHAKVAAGALIARAVELAIVHDLVVESDFYDLTDATLLDLLARRAERARPDVTRRIQSLLERFRHRRLMKRACVFPRYANESAQAELVARYFSPGRQTERYETEARISARVRAASGKDVEVVLYCPAARMQLKEAHTHVRWPGDARLRPLSEHAAKVARLADLERSYRDLWKFYVFADTSDAALLQRVQDVALEELPEATNVYRV